MGGFVDLSHRLEPGMPSYPGLREARFGAVMTHESSFDHYQGKANFFLGEVDMPTNIGTYLDAPFHRHPERRDLAGIGIEELCGIPTVVVDHDPDSGREVDVRLSAEDVRGKAVLVRTGWSARWGEDSYWEPGPFLSSASLDLLISSKARLVGVDFWNVDDTEDPARPAHTRLLEAEVLIVEHLCNLEELRGPDLRFFAPVLAVVGGASFPVRAFAEIA